MYKARYSVKLFQMLQGPYPGGPASKFEANGTLELSFGVDERLIDDLVFEIEKAINGHTPSARAHIFKEGRATNAPRK